MALHELELGRAELPGEAAAHARYVAVEHGRQIRVGERRVAARDELRQRQHLVRHGHLCEADFARESRGGDLVLRIAIAVQQHDRGAAEPRGVRGRKIAA